MADTHRLPSGYGAKFSMPFRMAVAFFDRDAGLAFADDSVRDARVLDLAAKISYETDARNEYPCNDSGRTRVETTDGKRIALNRPHMRGGGRNALTDGEIHPEAHANCFDGGWDDARASSLTDWAATSPAMASPASGPDRNPSGG